MVARWIERRFERLIWKFRLISIVPVVLSLLGSVGCFVIGAIEVFGADRCMFESNFPVDKRGAGYVPLWNSFKLIAAGCSADEKRDLFHDTAARAYRLPLLADT